MGRGLIIVSVVLTPLLALLLHVFLRSPITPQPLPLPSHHHHHLPPNNLLKSVEKLGEGKLAGPEDVCVDREEGTLYTATRDGWIKRMPPNGSWEDWMLVGGQGALGVAVSTAGGILVCDASKGLLRVGEEGVTTLASEVQGTKIRFADDVIEASDGAVYFTDVSTKFGFEDWFLDILEATPHGRLLKYDPLTKETSIVLAGLSFPNGIALSPNEDYLIFCETWKFRCLKYWLMGELRGVTEVFIDKLPGGPDNINLAPDGSFWIAILQLRSQWLDLVHGSRVAKYVLSAFPTLAERAKNMIRGGMVINVGADGKIRRAFDDSDGSVMSVVTSAVEHQGCLYLGSLASNFIGKLVL